MFVGTVFELRRLSVDGHTRLMKSLAAASQGQEASELLKRDIDVLSVLGDDLAISPLRSPFQRPTTALYQDVPGSLLSDVVCPTAERLEHLLPITRDLCRLLEATRDQGVVLRALGPDAFLYDFQTRRLRLANAAFAINTAQQKGWVAEPWFPREQIAYIAPEILGGNQARYDSRADLYSMGVLLYEFLAGQLPYDARDPSELIQCHLARAPIPLHERVPDLPASITSPIMRLLAKQPASRYRGPLEFWHGLASDLSGAALYNVPDLPAPSKRGYRPTETLYGRDRELQALCASMDRFHDGPALTLIESNGGDGKTALVHEAIGRVTTVAYVCEGRFEPNANLVPMAGWTGALNQLADLVLTRSSGDVDLWRRALKTQLGDLSPLLCQLAPRWEAVCGEAETSADRHTNTRLQRLGLTVARTLASLSDLDLPVTVFLDDFQWADSTSRYLLAQVLRANPPIPIHIIIAQRPSAGASSSDAGFALEHDSNLALERLNLKPLSEADVRSWLSEAFDAPVQGAERFADLVIAGTGGTPLYVRELFAAAWSRGIFAYHRDSNSWAWDERALAEVPLPNDLGAFFERRLEDLPPSTREALKLCACLGRRFAAEEFLEAKSAVDLPGQNILQPAVHVGLLRRLEDAAGTRFEFAHDRVLEACRASSSPGDSARLHLAVGRVLERMATECSDDALVYRVAGHFEAARALIADGADRIRCAQHCLRAGKMASDRAAFKEGLYFCEAGIRFLRDGTSGMEWQREFALSMELHNEAAQAYLLNGRRAEMRDICGTILDHARSTSEQVSAYETLIAGLKAEKKFPEAVDIALEVLARLGVSFPRRPTVLHLILGNIHLKPKIVARIPEIEGLGTCEDDKKIDIARVLEAIYPAAYLGRPELFPLIVYRHVNQCLRFGNDDHSATSYAGYAVVLCGTGHHELAFQLGEVALRLEQSSPSNHTKARVFTAHYFFAFPWVHQLAASIPPLEEGVRAGLENGDFEFASYLMTMKSLARLHSGAPLPELAEEFAGLSNQIGELKQERSSILEGVLADLVASLTAGTAIDPQDFNKRTGMAGGNLRDDNLVFHHHLAALMADVFRGDWEAAVEVARSARPHIEKGAFGCYLDPLFRFYAALASVRSTGRRTRWSRRSAKQLGRLAKQVPSNFRHRHALLLAEVARVSGDELAACRYYEVSISAARKYGYLHELALAHEFAASHYRELRLDSISRRHRGEAHAAFRRWGAVDRASRAEEPTNVGAPGESNSGNTLRGFHGELDYRSITRACQIISNETDIPRLGMRLLETIMEHSGAQRGAFIINRDGRFVVEGEVGNDAASSPSRSPIEVDESAWIAGTVVNYVSRIREPVAVGNSSHDTRFARDPKLRGEEPRAVLCVPALHNRNLVALVYLENRMVTEVFTPGRVEMVQMVAAQAAISIANTRFHELEVAEQSARVKPHFLFNALSSIADLIPADAHAAEAAQIQLADLYRYILRNSRGRMVPLEQELRIVSSYLSLEKLRFGERLEYEIQTDGDLQGVSLPGLIIQPLVENSLRHGIGPKLGVGHVAVNVVVSRGRCSITVLDDGEPSTTKSTQGTGFGLRSVQERLALAYQRDYKMSITRGDGFVIRIEIPCDGGGAV